MKSDIITIDNQGNGFENAQKETEKVSQYRDLTHKEALKLLLCTEELLSLARSVTGELKATFWLESEGRSFDLHLSTQTIMDREKRKNLIASATSRKNDAATSFLGKLRDKFEEAMTSDADYSIPPEALADLANHPIETPDWDGYENSVLRKVSDQVRISIRGGTVDMVVSKSFD